MNYINYFSHIVYDPLYYQRSYQNDLAVDSHSFNPKMRATVETTKEIVSLILPFLSLHQPLGQALSIGMGSVRCLSNAFTIGLKAYHREGVLAVAGQVIVTSLAVMALAGTLFKFQLGLLITTTVDIGINIVHILQHLMRKEYPEAFHECLQTLSSILYLCILLKGSLEVSLVSVLVQGVISLYQAYTEWKKGKPLMALGRLAMGGIRFYQGHQYLQLIQQRNQFLALEKFRKLLQQVEKGKQVSHLIHSPLDHHDQEVVLVDSQGKPYQFGSHFHGYGKELVKGMNVEFNAVVIDGKDKTELNFKVNHVFRSRLESLVKEMQRFTPDELKQFLTLTQSHAKELKIEEVPFQIYPGEDKTIGKAYKITLEGLGSVLIGNSPESLNLFDRVRVEIDKDKSLYECHELLSFFNLDDALRSSSAEDIERLKIGHLFRTFYPKEATLFEREEQFFTLPLDQLKAEIVKQVPDMQGKLTSYLASMEQTAILPGRMRYTIPELSQKAYELGGRALISTITGPEKEAFDRVASILKMGMISSEMRYSHGMNVSGLSSSADFYTGGADSVFTQLLTERTANQHMHLDALYQGKVRILFSLDLLNTGTYQYHSDCFGTRQFTSGLFFYGNKYLNRPPVLDFVKSEQSWFQHGHEVMIKERVPPSMIQGLVVSDEQTRQDLLSALRSCGTVVAGHDGETILGISVDRFIHVATHVSHELFSN